MQRFRFYGDNEKGEGMVKKVIPIFLFVILFFCGCTEKNERMAQAKEMYKEYPFHLLALENKSIDDTKNLDLSLINQSVNGRTPLQLLAEYHYQYRRTKKESR